MTNNRNKGKVGERWVATQLRPIWPLIRRNAGVQSQSGGVDLENTQPFDIEVKYGKAYVSKMIRSLIDQVEAEGRPENYKMVVVKPDREKAYCIIPLEDVIELLAICKTEGVI